MVIQREITQSGLQSVFLFILLMFVLVIVIYVVLAIYLNKLNELMYGKKTPLAWIPICNTYLLGKLTVNKIVGWVLVACCLLTATLTINANGMTTTLSLLPAPIRGPLNSLYSLVVFVLDIYLFVKYNKLKKEKEDAPQVNGTTNQAQVNQMPNNQPNMVQETIQQPENQTSIEQAVMTQPTSQAPIDQPVITQTVSQAPIDQPVMTQPVNQTQAEQQVMNQPVMAQPVSQAPVEQQAVNQMNNTTNNNQQM